MGRKCCVPNCKSGYQSQVKDTKTTFHKFWKEWENKIHRGGKWSMTTQSFICSKHFEENDFVYHTNDRNNRRKQKLQEEKIKYRHVKKGAYPTKFLNCPSYLSKTKPAERPFGSSDVSETI